ncbi:NfeD family protein [Actibacterium sp. 188UL27-1]|uniref:NfeD family protein n=1 Tax=Actibacterium sp. 188UL27-1 TaxID=2786961 RepID=UPI00195EF879|nr:hypothetical protein [Actibacterium sp. 188UL27-1]MBM7068952.1 hypothetical protein [Actibacterium sp. 188UL27-1]
METLWNTWWVWMAGALLFGILEMLIPGYVLLGFATGAALTGMVLVVTSAIGMSASLPALLAFFAIMSLASWIVLRKVFGLKTGSVQTFEHDINDN